MISDPWIHCTAFYMATIYNNLMKQIKIQMLPRTNFMLLFLFKYLMYSVDCFCV